MIITILHDHLNTRKLTARWVPQILTDEHKLNRLAAAAQFKALYHQEGEDLFDRIETGDEKWVHHYTPELKAASKQWVLRDEGCPKKAKIERSAGKVYLTCFWDSQGILLQEYQLKGFTTNKDMYFNILIRLKEAILLKRPRKLSRKILFMHDNAPEHRVGLFQGLLKDFCWDTLLHPAYFPDLAECDFYLFPQLQKAYAGHQFESDDEVEKFCWMFFQKAEVSFYASGIQKLLLRYQKCAQRLCDYVEK